MLRITEGADGSFDAPGSEASKTLHRFEPKSCARMQTKPQTSRQLADSGQSLRPHRLFALIALECVWLAEGQSNITNSYWSL